MPRATSAFLVVAFVTIGANAVFAPPAGFPAEGATILVERGSSVQEIATQLSRVRVITHSGLFVLLVRVSGRDSGIQAGPYRFDKPQNLLAVARRLFMGEHGIPPVRITFPEGETAREMAERIKGAFPEISAFEFLLAAKPFEGYLFPDTYFFEPWSDTETILRVMRENFDAKMAPLSGAIQASGLSLSDVVILSSLVEEEARSSKVRRTVAGILLNRLALGMPLQADAVFGYIFNRDTYSPSLEDLKVNSPYNTYLHSGLPPGPIANPGLESIKAVLDPEKTDYLYYLTGKDNLMHYAVTYSDHLDNQRKYLP